MTNWNELFPFHSVFSLVSSKYTVVLNLTVFVILSTSSFLCIMSVALIWDIFTNLSL